MFPGAGNTLSGSSGHGGGGGGGGASVFSPFYAAASGTSFLNAHPLVFPSFLRPVCFAIGEADDGFPDRLLRF